jgi:DNA end-binding protein Ku
MGKKIIEEADNGPDKRGSNVVDLMAALKKSLEKGGSAAPAKKAPAKAAPKKAPVKKRA